MIASKAEFLKLWNSGLLGNKLRSWASLAEADGYPGLFGLRDGRPNSNLSRYHLRRDQVAENVREMEALGARGVYLGESAPDERLLLQGEYFDGRTDGAVYNRCLTYSTEKTQMKRVKVWRHIEGAATTAVLRAYLSPDSYDDFQALLEQYPGHVIEFGAYEHNLGSLPGRNTIIWEVRGY